MKKVIVGKSKGIAEAEQCDIHVVSSSLSNLTTADKYTYLFRKVYENVTHSSTGRLLVNTHYCRKAAELLGGDYDKLSKTGKSIFKNDITDEAIYIEKGFERYLTY
jgi:hypothetical protein